MYYIGVDLGQSRDYTAIVIVEKEDARLINQPLVYNAQRPVAPNLLVRRIERVPLGTSYPQIVERIRAITHEPAIAGRCALVVDATGVGAPVVDMLRQPGTGCDITAVTITSGERESRRGFLHYNVPRRDLLDGVLLALEQGRLRICGHLAEAQALGRELISMRSGRDTPGHDDFVFALSLACWRANRKSVWGAGRLPGI